MSSFVFDNAAHQTTVALLPQPRVQEGFDHARGLPHPLVFSDNYPNFSLRGKAKGAEGAVGGPMALSLCSSVQKSDAKTGLLVPMPVAAILRWIIPGAGIHTGKNRGAVCQV